MRRSKKKTFPETLYIDIIYKNKQVREEIQVNIF